MVIRCGVWAATKSWVLWVSGDWVPAECNSMSLLILETTIHYSSLIDPSHKSHNAWDNYPIMHHFVTEMCTHVHISVTKLHIVGYGAGALWDLWNGSVDINGLCLFFFHCCVFLKIELNTKKSYWVKLYGHMDGLVHDCAISVAFATKIPQSPYGIEFSFYS